MIDSIRHAGIVVRDMDNCLRFYRDMLQLRVTWDRLESGDYLEKMLGVANIKVRTVKLMPPGGGPVLELLNFITHDDNPDKSKMLYSKGFTHVALTVRGLNDLYEVLQQHNVPCISAPVQSGDGCVNVMFCQDPEQNFLELVEDIKRTS